MQEAVVEATILQLVEQEELVVVVLEEAFLLIQGLMRLTLLAVAEEVMLELL